MSTQMSAQLAEQTQSIQALLDSLGRVILGKPQVIERTVVALVAGGHLLIEDVPGVGKTVLARALAASVGARYSRIQFTPDLLPADITGTSIYREGEFNFHQGPVFANILLADEINRATPRTQASLLEAMEEAQVTADGISHALPSPFFVIATQNPIELAGTYPLPEAQLDRFLMRISIGYPASEDEIQILTDRQQGDPMSEVSEVLTLDGILALQQAARAVSVDQSIKDFIVRIVSKTRERPELDVGASPRAALALMRAAQSLALVRGGESFITPDHVKQLAPAVLAHRLVLSAKAQLGQTKPETIVSEILREVTVPVELDD